MPLKTDIFFPSKSNPNKERKQQKNKWKANENVFYITMSPVWFSSIVPTDVIKYISLANLENAR